MLGKVVRTKVMYSLQMAVFFEHLIKFMIVMRQELIVAFELFAFRQYWRKTFKRTPA